MSINNRVFTDFRAGAVSGSDFAKVGIQAFLNEKRRCKLQKITEKFEAYNSQVTELERVNSKPNKRHRTEKKKKKKEQSNVIILKKRSTTHKIEKNPFAERVITESNLV